MTKYISKNFALKFQAIAEKNAKNLGLLFLPHPVDITPDLLLLIQQKLCIVQYIKQDFCNSTFKEIITNYLFIV